METVLYIFYLNEFIMKYVILTGIDSVGKSTIISKLPWKNTIKYPRDEDIKNQINSLYKVLTEGGKELHEGTVRNIYRSIHDLYDKDFRIPIPENHLSSTEPLLIFDRYFIDNIVYSRSNGVEREEYSDGHQVIPDLVIMIKVRNYSQWKEKFVQKGDENIREPAILFHEVQKEMQDVLKWLQETKKIKRYTVVEGLVPTTTEKITEIIKELIAATPAYVSSSSS